METTLNFNGEDPLQSRKGFLLRPDFVFLKIMLTEPKNSRLI